MERAISLMMLERMRGSGAEFRQVLSLGGGSPPAPGLTLASLGETFLRETVNGAQRASWRWYSSYPDQLRALQGYEALLDGFCAVKAGQPFKLALSRQQARLAALDLPPHKEGAGRLFNTSGPDLRTWFSDSVVSMDRVLHRVLAAEISRDLATTALALKRYQMRHGQYPSELSALVPELLASIPRDPVDGQPLRYHLKPDGSFLLYSIGEDGKDDGGDASPPGKSDTLNWQRGRDVVWPSVATAEEVRAYQQKQAAKRRR